jgi:site-specific recombinase XerD
MIGGTYPVGKEYFANKFRRYKAVLGLDEKSGIYRYKHTRGMHLAEDGEDLIKIMRLFRHRDLATTMLYLRGMGADPFYTESSKGRKF